MSFQLIDQKCQIFINYINKMILPGAKEFFYLLEENKLELYKTFSFNSILAHAVDYMALISDTILETNKQRPKFRGYYVKTFDKIYMVNGAGHINNKFRLVDAINNSFKHAELDTDRYSDLIDEYGGLSFQSLEEINGKVFFVSNNYRFDYSRVVIRPIFNIFNCGINTTEDVLRFINGEVSGISQRMPAVDKNASRNSTYKELAYNNNSLCMDCGESEVDCDCFEFLFGGESGVFNPVGEALFDCDTVIGQISGLKNN